MMPVMICGRVHGPRALISSLMSSRPPGISVISGLKMVINSTHAMSRKVSASGTPTAIQRPKPRVTSQVSAMYAFKNAFGGVPIRVPSEPMEAEYAMPSMRAVANFFCLSQPPTVSAVSASTDVPIGSMTTAVAVFDTHMDKKPVASIKPKMRRRGEVPMSFTT